MNLVAFFLEHGARPSTDFEFYLLWPAMTPTPHFQQMTMTMAN